MPTSVTDCPFCVIARGNDPSTRTVYRDENIVAFFPLEPAILGHTLLVPQAHVPNVWALDDQTAELLARATVHLAKAVRKAMTPEGLNIIQSNGEVAMQSVPHLHVHIVPRWQGDALGPIWPESTKYSEAQKNDAWYRVKQECERAAGEDG